MKIGLALPHYDFSFPDGRPSRVADVVAAACRAEDAGFDSVWVSDHLFLSLERYGGPAGRVETPEVMTMATAIAAATDRVTVGTLVVCVPFRNAAVLAQQARSIQDLSGGRFIAGLGAGWNEPEFVEAGIPFESPGVRIDELEAVASVVRAEAPVVIGGKGGPKIAGVVARTADTWNIVWEMTPERYEGLTANIDAACAAEGRAPAEVGRSVGLYTLLAEDPDDLAARYARMQAGMPGTALDAVPVGARATTTLTGTLDECIRTIKTYESLGVDEMILSLAPLPFAIFEDEQVDLAARLIEAVR
jgi:alkanesulfonate monooxygenase SsuD/methylene tetrahydromethanopterin reductase-like flavin-dependent oxidoreductase (luciferase family)